jgi:hypothetical protein
MALIACGAGLGRGRAGSGDAQKHLLREVSRRLHLPDEPAEIPKDPVTMLREQNVGARHLACH